jgi:hypothetical protein
MSDAVNHPAHYLQNPSGIEVIDVTEHLNFCMGNAVKYILRADHKGDPLTDLHKAEWYIAREIKRREIEQAEASMDGLFEGPGYQVLVHMGVAVEDHLQRGDE